MNAITTSLEPPRLALATDDEGDADFTIEIHVELVEADGTRRTASAMLAADASDVTLADALIRCLRGLAEMRGPGLRAAIQRWVPTR